jgi:peptide/nickel transport system permease protein
MRKKYSAAFKAGIGIVAVFFVTAIFAPVLSPHAPNKIGPAYLRPSRQHLLGTNDVGQDIFSELIYGTRISLTIGLVAAFIVTIIGTFLGMSAGYFRGRIDKVISALIDVTMALPSLPLAFVLAAVLPSGTLSLIVVICITSWTATARIVRSKTMQIREMPFVLASKAMGTRSFRIMIEHIFPNLAELIFTKGMLAVSGAMLMESSLSFLGLGMQTEKSWGRILQFALKRNGILNGYWWWYLPPIICISLCVMGFMLISYQRESSLRETELKG